MEWQETRLTGWGRLRSASVVACSPQSEQDLVAALAQHAPHGIIPFGNGRSYGDQALNDGGRTLLTRRLNRILTFDRQSSELVCEAGTTLADLNRRFVPEGYVPPVSPGTGYVTVGGAVANDVHGKNHDKHGGFSHHVRWLDLVLANGDTVRIGPDNHPDWYAATVGGAGLTGVIVRVCLQMMPVPSNAVLMREEPIAHIDGLIERLESLRNTATFLVAWIDALAAGSRLGRGILESAEFSPEGVTQPVPRRLGMPIDLPGFVLNPLAIKVFNELYFHRLPRRGRDRLVAIERFLYPLDAIDNWNRMYGRRGFFQFQCVLPDAAAGPGLRKLLTAIARHRAASFLAVLKTLGGWEGGMLSFPIRGYTLALDLPNRDGVRALLAELEATTLDHGGRVYLAKDATLSASGFQRMYPRLDQFLEVLEAVDPERTMRSDMARRLLVHRFA
jgi:decaprenylphospho-beta-D-ribofuranose 2-oxidase